MNQQQRIKIGELWIGLAAMYGRELPRETVRIMLNAVDDLEPEKVIEALEQWARTSKQTRHPVPAEVRSMVNPQVSPEAAANEAASRIRAAITRFGWANPGEARGYVGSLAWAVIERSGGWLYLCENLGQNLNPLTFHAQARDLAKSMLESSAAGVFDKPIEIEHKERKEISESSKLNLPTLRSIPD